MTLRIPHGTDQTVQTMAHEIERRLRKLENRVLGIGEAGRTVIRVSGGGGGGAVNTTAVLERIEKIEEELARLGSGAEIDLDTIPTFGGVGDESRRGFVPAPGTAEPPSGVAGHVLKEDGTWGYPFRGLIRVATDGTEDDVVDIHADVHTLDLSAASIECFDLRTHGDVEYGDSFWDDLKVDIISTKVGATTYQPAWTQMMTDGAGSRGVYTWGFSASNENEVWFDVQLPHAWKEGSAIYPHIHWAPVDTDTGTVDWGLEYTVASVNGTFGNTTTITVTDAGDGTAYKHQIAAFAPINMGGHTLSSVIMCRLFRDPSADTYGDVALALSVDFHVELDSPGSSQEYTK